MKYLIYRNNIFKNMSGVVIIEIYFTIMQHIFEEC